MKKIMNKVLICSLLVFFSLVSFGIAADYPNGPIRVIIPWSTGGASDILCRAFQPFLEKELGQRILIENIPGGSTKVGTDIFLKAKPDGYTLIFSNECWIGRYYTKVYDRKIWEEMVPIASITSEPLAIVEVKGDSPYKTMEGLLRAAKENPGKISCSNPGAGTPLDIIFYGITKKAGVKIQYVPFAGGGKAKLAMLGGHVDFRIGQIAESIELIRSGKTRALAVSTSKRMSIIPDVPTLKELKFIDGELYEQIRGFWGPPNLPSGFAEKLSCIIEKATKNKDFIKLAEKLTYSVDFRSADKVKEFMRVFEKEFGHKLANLKKK